MPPAAQRATIGGAWSLNAHEEGGIQHITLSPASFALVAVNYPTDDINCGSRTAFPVHE